MPEVTDDICHQAWRVVMHQVSPQKFLTTMDLDNPIFSTFHNGNDCEELVKLYRSYDGGRLKWTGDFRIL